MNDLLGADPPKNWGKWGPTDELGCLNYLDAKEVLRGAQHIRTATCSPYDARTTVGTMDKASVLPIAEKASSGAGC